jgi:3-hydroxyacyl-[acyl-carrier-protein] dehydratase
MRFLFVDRILEMVPGKCIRAVKLIAPDEDYFRDHFPGFPVVPGVLLTEMMAQTAGKCLDAEDRARGKAMLARIQSASFREWVRPGQTAVIYAEVRSSRSQFATANGWIEVAGRRVCSAEMMFSFVAMEQLAPGYRDEVLEAFLAGESSAARPADCAPAPQSTVC